MGFTILLLGVGLAGVIGAYVVEPWFERSMLVDPNFQHAAEPSLIVLMVTVVGVVVAAVNLVLAASGRSLPLAVPERFGPLLRGILSVGIGVLIGTTIFR